LSFPRRKIKTQVKARKRKKPNHHLNPESLQLNDRKARMRHTRASDKRQRLLLQRKRTSQRYLGMIAKKIRRAPRHRK